jgi:hypothetical protein
MVYYPFVTRLILILVVAIFAALHQDIWLWTEARPLLFGLIPVGLFYHVCYTAAVAVVMWLLVRYAWPSHLEDLADHPSRPGDHDA